MFMHATPLNFIIITSTFKLSRKTCISKQNNGTTTTKKKSLKIFYFTSSLQKKRSRHIVEFHHSNQENYNNPGMEKSCFIGIPLSGQAQTFSRFLVLFCFFSKKEKQHYLVVKDGSTHFFKIAIPHSSYSPLQTTEGLYFSFLCFNRERERPTLKKFSLQQNLLNNHQI